VTDITGPKAHLPHEIVLVDVRNDDARSTPVERAGIIVSIPHSALDRFGARSLADRYDRKTVVVTGMVETEPHPFGSDARGEAQLGPKICIADPMQIRVE
jgi:hypothetical protein